MTQAEPDQPPEELLSDASAEGGATSDASQDPRRRSSRSESLIAAAMAIVLLVTAFAAWRASDLGSRAGDAERLGLIQSIQQQDFLNIDWQKAYQEAGHAQRYLLAEAEVAAMEMSGDPGLAAQAANQRKYVLPNLALLGEPLASDPAYSNPDGSLAIERRFSDLQASNADQAALDPQAAFIQAEYFQSQQRGYFVGAVVLALSLLWLGLAEITRGKARTTGLVLGIVIFVFGLTWIAGLELLWALARWVEA